MSRPTAATSSNPALAERVHHWRQIAVAVDGSGQSHEVLRKAAELSCRQRARLTIVYILPYPSGLAVTTAGVFVTERSADPLADASGRLRQMTASLPSDLSCTMLVRCGGAFGEVRRLLIEDRHDAVLVSLHHHGMVRRAAFRWAVARCLRRAHSDLVLLGGRKPALVTALADASPPAVGGHHDQNDEPNRI